MCLSPSSSSNYACAVSWVCKWTSGRCIYLWHVTACTYFLSSLKEGSGSLEFNTFSLWHFPSAIRGISNDSAWILHAAVQLCDTFKWRELAVTEPWLSSCAPETFFLLLFFFSLLDICPLPSQCEEKSHYSCKKRRGPLQSGLNCFLYARVNFCITEKNTVGRIVHWKTLIIYRPPLTVARDSLPAAQTLILPLKICVAPSFYIL